VVGMSAAGGWLDILEVLLDLHSLDEPFPDALSMCSSFATVALKSLSPFSSSAYTTRWPPLLNRFEASGEECLEDTGAEFAGADAGVKLLTPLE